MFIHTKVDYNLWANSVTFKHHFIWKYKKTKIQTNVKPISINCIQHVVVTAIVHWHKAI